MRIHERKPERAPRPGDIDSQLVFRAGREFRRLDHARYGRAVIRIGDRERHAEFFRTRRVVGVFAQFVALEHGNRLGGRLAVKSARHNRNGVFDDDRFRRDVPQFFAGIERANRTARRRGRRLRDERARQAD